MGPLKFHDLGVSNCLFDVQAICGVSVVADSESGLSRSFLPSENCFECVGQSVVPCLGEMVAEALLAGRSHGVFAAVDPGSL